jgi:hypothetical protein
VLLFSHLLFARPGFLSRAGSITILIVLLFIKC